MFRAQFSEAATTCRCAPGLAFVLTLCLVVAGTAGCELGSDASVSQVEEVDEAREADVDEGDELAASDQGATRSASPQPSHDAGSAAARDERAAEVREQESATPLRMRPREGEAEQERRPDTRPSQPSAVGKTIEVQPPSPSAGDTVRVRAGPLTFRNGCEGIARSRSRGPDAGGTIHVGWEPRQVSPDEMCTQAMHDMWIDVELQDLGPGSYTIQVDGVGTETLEVSGPN
jgi:hypothetical protein